MMARPLIMIVDDDSDDRDILRDAFRAAANDEIDFLMAENGDKAISQLDLLSEDENRLPNIIMLDLNMPGRDGRETLTDLKKHPVHRTIPTLVFTTSSSPRDKHTVYELSGNCFITKPDTFNKLVGVCESILKLFCP